MPHYSVDVMLGHLVTEVEADDEDAAIQTAISEWMDEADDILCGGTFGVYEIEADDVRV